jgi:hypothetical protein
MLLLLLLFGTACKSQLSKHFLGHSMFAPAFLHGGNAFLSSLVVCRPIGYWRMYKICSCRRQPMLLLSLLTVQSWA